MGVVLALVPVGLCCFGGCAEYRIYRGQHSRRDAFSWVVRMRLYAELVVHVQRLCPTERMTRDVYVILSSVLLDSSLRHFAGFLETRSERL